MNYEHCIEIRNETDYSVNLIIEPWGMVLDFPSQACYEIVASGSIPGEIEVEQEDENFIVWGWSTSVMKIKWKGEEIHRETVPVPGVPEGQTIPDFLKMILGSD